MLFNLFLRIQNRVHPITHQMYTHPFNVALAEGTLSESIFKTFLEQDHLYLHDFSKALHITAARLTDTHHRQIFQALADHALKTEMKFHNKYLRQYQPLHFFKAPELKIPVIHQYTKHLLTHAHHAPVAVSVASLIPCFYIYSQLGLYLRPVITADNPYHQWLSSYTNPRFLKASADIIQVFNELTDKLVDEQKVIAAFEQSLHFEITFWDSVYRLENNISHSKSM